MGKVYLAEDTQLGRKVAIKTVRQILSSDIRILSRTHREGVILASLNHPALATVFEVNMTSTFLYIVQEYIDGHNLSSLIEQGNLLDESAAIKLLKEQAEALAYLHQKTIFHRDIKPENIMIDSSGKSRLMDFGLALSNNYTRITQKGEFVGTLKYCPPEVMQETDGGAPSDIYQLGLTLYSAMTGKSLFGKFESVNDFIAILFSREWENYNLVDDLSPKMATLIKACVRFEAKYRIQNGTELCRYIEEKIECSEIKPKRSIEKTAINHEKKQISNLIPPEQMILDEATLPSIDRKKTLQIIGGKAAKAVKASTKRNICVTTKRRIYFATICISLIFIMQLLLLFIEQIEPYNTPVSLPELSKKARNWAIFPNFIYIFLPSTIGTSLNFKFQPDSITTEIPKTISGSFKRVAGGWKAFINAQMMTKNKRRLSGGFLILLNERKVLSKGHITFPKSPFKIPFKVNFDFDSIYCTWKLNENLKTMIPVEKLNPDLTVLASAEIDCPDNECNISLDTLGFSGNLKLSLIVSEIPGHSKGNSTLASYEVCTNFTEVIQHSKTSKQSDMENKGERPTSASKRKKYSKSKLEELRQRAHQKYIDKDYKYSAGLYKKLYRNKYKQKQSLYYLCKSVLKDAEAPEKAIKYIKLYIKKYENNIDMQECLGKAYGLNCQFKKQILCFKKCIQSEYYDGGSIHFQLAIAYDNLCRCGNLSYHGRCQHSKMMDHANLSMKIDPRYKNKVLKLIFYSNYSLHLGRFAEEVLSKTEDGRMSDKYITEFTRRFIRDFIS